MPSIARTKLKRFALGALVTALGAGTYVIAAVTFSDFQAGTTISASEMNAKLNALKDAANANAASVNCPANAPTRFTDNGDGTVCDRDTGLMWEIKTDDGTVHDKDNFYRWTVVVVGPCTAIPFPLDCVDADGTLYTDFLAELNDLKQPNDGTATTCFSGHCDWRIPTIEELRSILAPSPCTAPCIAAGFPGPTQPDFYWSSTTAARFTFSAWHARFDSGNVGFDTKGSPFFARAVRGGR